jgi:hypothetical protein
VQQFGLISDYPPEKLLGKLLGKFAVVLFNLIGPQGDGCPGVHASQFKMITATVLASKSKAT